MHDTAIDDDEEGPTMTSQRTLPAPSRRPDPAGQGSATLTGRLHTAADALWFVAVLNALVLTFTLAGGILLGWAPALAAAVACSRRRARGDAVRTVSLFASTWRQGFVRSNLVLAAPGTACLLIGSTLVALHGHPGHTALLLALWTAGGIALAHLLLTACMDSHYDLPPGRCLRLAGEFMLRFPGAPLLLLVTTTLVTAATLVLPGLAPILSIGWWLHLCSLLCLSFFAANDRALATADAHPGRALAPASTTTE